MVNLTMEPKEQATLYLCTREGNAKSVADKYGVNTGSTVLDVKRIIYIILKIASLKRHLTEEDYKMFLIILLQKSYMRKKKTKKLFLCVIYSCLC